MKKINNSTKHYLWLVLLGMGLLTILFAGEEGVTADKVDTAVATHTAFLPLVQTPPPPPTLALQQFATGFNTDSITDIANAGDSRLFVLEREGEIRIVQSNGQLVSEPFLNIKEKVQHSRNWEQGLLGIAFHPDFPAKPYFYLSYTIPEYSRLRIARYTVEPATPNRVDPETELVLMDIDKTKYNDQVSPVHQGGDMAFGPDGMLYIAVGDGGPDPAITGIIGDPANSSQRLGLLLGKMLRIDVDGAGGVPADCGSTDNYTVPADNPYVGRDGCDEIWASGLRNPWRFAIDPVTGDMFIADVGEARREEIDYQAWGTPGGVNYGWHCYEGTFDYTQVKPDYERQCGPASEYSFPIFEYDHETASTCASVTGGLVYRGQAYPNLYGRYIFTDLCTREMYTIARDGGEEWQVDPAGTSPISITTFGEDVEGELYAGRYLPGGGSNSIYRVIVTDPTR